MRDFGEAYEAARDAGDRNRTATILANLGAAHERLGDSARSAAALKQAEELTDDLGAKPRLVEALRALAKAHLVRHEHAKAIDLLVRSVKLLEAAETKIELGVVLRLLGEASFEGASAPQTSAESPGRAAAAPLKRAIALFEEIGNDVELARTCRAYADVLARTPEYVTDGTVKDEAKRLATRADEIFAKLRANGGHTHEQALFAG